MHLAKETFKFSSTHFTVFSATEAELLHGHNYQGAVECSFEKLDEFGMGFEFNRLKPHIKVLTEAWDERVLIPSACPHLRVNSETVRDEAHVVVDFMNRSYRFPKADVVMLDAVNVTSEELARIFARSLAGLWRAALSNDDLADTAKSLATRIQSLEITVEETRGQRASFKLSSPLNRTDLK